ncbi:ABC transporter ATP-binding protein [Paenibacillus larvae]|uniref:ABC transporter ATP-binding protein n=1 Tax=Paenibacillus larvae TaxID=1464 RepID=UPI002853FC68|nr:ABC transporter ATP-binding protein [Paenibacillus larvae]MDR5585230.1 ABC transporter ATP-binding protein [Paenibacillus larvae]
MLILKQVTKKYGKKLALHPVNVQLDKGVIGLLGPNGAGKTTLLRILATYHSATTGTISLNQVAWAADIEKIRTMIGYLPQHIGIFPNLTVHEYLEYMGTLRNMDNQTLKQKIPSILEDVRLQDQARKKVKQLSGGMKQRLGIGQAILHEPELLLVDEPTAGLDPEERIRFRHLIKRLSTNRIVILSTHITEDVAVTCDQVLLMNKGKLEKYESVQQVTDNALHKVWLVEANFSEYERLRNNEDMFITNVTEHKGRYQLMGTFTGGSGQSSLYYAVVHT